MKRIVLTLMKYPLQMSLHNQGPNVPRSCHSHNKVKTQIYNQKFTESAWIYTVLMKKFCLPKVSQILDKPSLLLDPNILYYNHQQELQEDS